MNTRNADGRFRYCVAGEIINLRLGDPRLNLRPGSYGEKIAQELATIRRESRKGIGGQPGKLVVARYPNGEVKQFPNVKVAAAALRVTSPAIVVAIQQRRPTRQGVVLAYAQRKMEAA